MRELLAEKDARIVDLRTQVEAANRQAAEATAALREYLKMQAKALPEGESNARNIVDASARGSLGSAANRSGEQRGANSSNRLTWRRLRELRAIFRKLLGLR